MDYEEIWYTNLVNIYLPLCDTRYLKLHTVGIFTLGDLMTILLYPGTVVVIVITAADIFQAMETGLAQWPGDTGKVL